ncbi:MAG: hypothetical protein JO353_14045 [Phycisphaerae bacterium]|nr:hypothetical protein [Phycisphaerae bacterium]
MRRGFSFTEILFAVTILGIGFIMVAAIFPVAIEQGRVTNEQSIAAGVARGGLAIMTQVASNSDTGVIATYGNGTFSYNYPYSLVPSDPSKGSGPLFPATGTFNASTGLLQTTGNVWSIRDPLIPNFPQLRGFNGTIGLATNRNVSPALDQVWQRLSQSLIIPADPRFAFVGLYRRDGDPRDRRTWSPYAQVWFLPTTVRSRTQYTMGSAGTDVGTIGFQNLTARMTQVRIDIAPGTAYTSQPTGGYILFNYSAAAPYQSTVLATGSYVIIGRDNLAAPDSGRMNGRIYHVGVRRPDLDTSSSDPDGAPAQAYELAPDGDFVPDAGADTIFPSADDIYAIGNKNAVGPSSTMKSSAPADAYIIGTDVSAGAEAGPAQDISAFSTFVKVN